MLGTHCAPRKYPQNVALLCNSLTNLLFPWVTTKPNIKTKRRSEVRHRSVHVRCHLHIFHFSWFHFTLSWITCFALLGVRLPSSLTTRKQTADLPHVSPRFIFFCITAGHLKKRPICPTNQVGNFTISFFFPLSLKSWCTQLYCCIRADFLKKMLLILTVVEQNQSRTDTKSLRPSRLPTSPNSVRKISVGVREKKASKASTTLIVSKHNERSTYWFYIPLQAWPTSSELFDQSKQRRLLQRVCLVGADMLRLAITGGVCSGSLQANQKGPEGQNQSLIRCVWGTMRKRPLSAT